MSKYKQINDENIFLVNFSLGDPIIMHFACSDCGVVHDFEFTQNTKGEVFFKIRRNERRTGQKRRNLKTKKP